jgi:hypothetical protein
MPLARVNYLGNKFVDGHRVAEVRGVLNDIALARIPYSVRDIENTTFVLQYDIGASLTLAIYSTLADMDKIKLANYTTYTWTQEFTGLTGVGTKTFTSPMTGIRLDFGGTGGNSGHVRFLF